MLYLASWFEDSVLLCYDEVMSGILSRKIDFLEEETAE
jgi:hypothetical protein